MSRAGEWNEMARQVPDDVLDLFVARAPYEGLAEAVEKRFGGTVDTVSVDFAEGTPASVRRDTIAALQRIPGGFKGFAA